MLTQTENLCGAPYLFSGAADQNTRDELAKLFTRRFGQVPIGGMDTYSCVPLAMHAQQVSRLEKMVVVLNRALRQVVANYFHDERIRAIYGLDMFLESVLKMADGLPYHIGACRPDFLQTESGGLKICEIGARFPLNGWMISHYFNDMESKLQTYPDHEIKPVPELDGITTHITRFFDVEKPVTLLLDHEQGSEIHWFLEDAAHLGLQAYTLKPQALQLRGETIYADGKPMCQFILEMDREELRKFDPHVLRKLIETATYFNDVRTLILVHDKRVLSVLYDENIMLDYLSARDYDFLRPFLIPSFSLRDARIRKKITTDDVNWVLKQSSGGRGVGMYIRNECEVDLWKETVEDEWPSYMVQEYIPQRLYHIENRPIQIVGMLLCFNDTFFGPGIYRGSHHSVVNVHQGRGVIFPPSVFI